MGLHVSSIFLTDMKYIFAIVLLVCLASTAYASCSGERVNYDKKQMVRKYGLYAYKNCVSSGQWYDSERCLDMSCGAKLIGKRGVPGKVERHYRITSITQCTWYQ